jgi:hypothetical protein
MECNKKDYCKCNDKSLDDKGLIVVIMIFSYVIT